VVWSKSYGSSAIPLIGMLLLVALILLGLTAWVVSGILECNALCEEYPWYCRRDSWSCEIRYPNYIRVDYVFPVFLGFFALIIVLGATRILFSDISYVEVSGRGFLIVRGYLRRRETLISKEEIQEVRFQHHKLTWLYPIFLKGWSAPVLLYSGAGVATIVTKSGLRVVIPIHAGDLLKFTKAVEEEVGVKVVEAA